MANTGTGGIGIFGGTFDPVHNGHLLVAQDAVECFNLEKLFFVPAKKNPLKVLQPVGDDEARLEMVRLATANDDRFRVSDVELAREGPSYAFDTVQAFRQMFPDRLIYWLIGADQLKGLHRWYKIEQLVRIVTFLVMSRPGFEYFEPEISGLKIEQLPDRQLDISATEIRERALQQKRLDYFLPASVLLYIRENRLYHKDTTPSHI